MWSLNPPDLFLLHAALFVSLFVLVLGGGGEHPPRETHSWHNRPHLARKQVQLPGIVASQPTEFISIQLYELESLIL